MFYDFRNDNYKNFDVFKDNVLKQRAYFIPFKSREALEVTDIRTERFSSDKVRVLSGEWDFVYYPECDGLPKDFYTSTVKFDKVTVPSCWQFTGYENPVYLNTRYEFKSNPPEIPRNCSVGVYRKFFDASEDREYILSFLGVAGALDVYLNGCYVGYHECAHNTCEFDITPFITDGKNELIALVHKFSNSTYLECQDMFRNNGIFRDVLLFENDGAYLYDYEVKTAYSDGKYDLEITFDVKGDADVTASLKFGDGEIFTAKAENNKIEVKGLTVKEWSAEIPNLYTLFITLEKYGEELEIIRRPLGFKHIEIKGNVFCFNNEKIKLLGVNHHDTNPKTGYVLSVEDMERDVKIFKEYNCNCVRTSHYPPDAIFIDLCDEYGIYVVDEADIETHGVVGSPNPGACSHNPAWRDRYVFRVMGMFERDKNHPSITMWSLGNESWGYSNQDACCEELKKRTPIPIHYEGAVRTRRFAYDVISQMYPWQGKMKKLADGKGLAKKWYSKPYFLCEYAHAMGVGAGELETYVSDILRADNLMGGCIWEFADHAVEHENGRFKYTYGGDHGEKKHDGNFCVDGLFFPDRTPHSGAIQMKNCYSPVRVEVTDEALVFKNLNYFAPVELTVKWDGINERTKKSSGEFDFALPPRGEKKAYLQGSAFKAVNFRYFIGGRKVAEEGICSTDAPLFEKKKCGDFPYGITFGKNRIFADINGVKCELGVSVFRAPIDNDRNFNIVWKKFNIQSEHLKLISTRGNVAKYKLITNSNKILAKITISYTKSDYGLTLNLKCDSAKTIPFTPRFGLTLKTDKKYENVKYFGFGDRVNLPDFLGHALLGEYFCKVDEMREKYIKPQESSMRSGVRYAEISDRKGNGLRFEQADSPFIFGADRFTSQQCANAMHQEELSLEDFTYLHFDSYQLGAGSAACGPPPTKKYRRNSVKGCKLSITVKPI